MHTKPIRSLSVATAAFAVIVLLLATAPRPAASRIAMDPLPGWAVQVQNSTGSLVRARTSHVHLGSGAFALAPGETLHPSINATRLTAVVLGDLRLDKPGRYRFGATVQGGKVRLSISGAGLATPLTLETTTVDPTTKFTPYVELPAGEVSVRYIFNRQGNRRARLRPVWQRDNADGTGFVPEPIPNDVVTVPAASRANVEAARLAAHGRTLIGEMGCVQCHVLQHDNIIPLRAAPDLEAIATRADTGWVRAWIDDPHGMKPTSVMPDVLTPGESQAADDIAHFLASLGGDAPPPVEGRTDDLFDTGRRLYQTVGCVACHGDFESELADEPPVPHGDLAGKWTRAPLAAFLRDPHASRPSGRMPSMRLDQAESNAIATYLVETFGASDRSFTADPSRVDAGRDAFVAQGCASCHEVQGLASRPARELAIVRPRSGCLDPSDLETPRYPMTDGDRGAIRAALDELSTWTGDDSPIEFAARTVEALECSACHTWDGEGGVRDAVNDNFGLLEEADLGDDGRLPPRLTGVGWKLQSNWLEEVLIGGAQARPYMSARMPQYGADHVGHLVDALAFREGIWPRTDARAPESNDDLVRAGHQLVGDGGINCISCHVFGETPQAGTPGPDIAMFAERIRYEWWRAFIREPSRFKPGTRMVSPYATGHGAVTSVLGGDPRRQTEAMWSYFRLGDSAPTPSGVPTAGGLPIRVTGRPVVMRTFLASAGSRGIAVGFSDGVHFAFDATNLRLAEAWQGTFLDGSGAWAGRGGQITDGKGQTVWSAPEGASVYIGARQPALNDPAPAMRFGGYALDDAGVPTFNYTIGGATVSETFRPDTAGALFERAFVFGGVPPGHRVWIADPGGVGVRASSGATVEQMNGWIRLTLTDDEAELVLEVSR